MGVRGSVVVVAGGACVRWTPGRGSADGTTLPTGRHAPLASTSTAPRPLQCCITTFFDRHLPAPATTTAHSAQQRPQRAAMSSTAPGAAAPATGGDKGKLTMPRDQSALEQAAAPIATLASHADPWPHYLMTAACGASAAYSYSSLNNPRMAGIKAALGLAYLFAGRQLVSGNPQLGYDVGSITSLALVGVAGPTARATSEMSAVAMTALGGISSVSNLIKSYEMRTGKPKEMGYERERSA